METVRKGWWLGHDKATPGAAGRKTGLQNVGETRRPQDTWKVPLRSSHLSDVGIWHSRS